MKTNNQSKVILRSKSNEKDNPKYPKRSITFFKVNSPKTGPKVKPKLDGSGNIEGEAETY